MALLKYLLMVTGIGLLIAAAAILAWDLYKILRGSKLPGAPGELLPPDRAPLLGPAGSLAAAFQLALARKLGLPGFGLLLAGLSIVVVPSGSAGVRVNQFVGTRPKTLYPGVHFVIPLIESLETYKLKETVFATSIPEGFPNPKDDARARVKSLRVQTREGVLVNLAVAVRHRIDPSKLAYINANVRQPIEEQLVGPAV